MLGNLRAGQRVYAAANAYQIPAANEPEKVFPGDAKVLYVPWPKDRLFASQFEDSAVGRKLRLFRYAYRFAEI